MTWHLTFPTERYETAREEFIWEIPEGFNAAHGLVGKHDDPEARVALFQAYPDGRREPSERSSGGRSDPPGERRSVVVYCRTELFEARNRFAGLILPAVSHWEASTDPPE
jgi:hypothetical protein